MNTDHTVNTLNSSIKPSILCEIIRVGIPNLTFGYIYLAVTFINHCNDGKLMIHQLVPTKSNLALVCKGPMMNLKNTDKNIKVTP